MGFFAKVSNPLRFKTDWTEAKLQCELEDRHRANVNTTVLFFPDMALSKSIGPGLLTSPKAQVKIPTCSVSNHARRPDIKPLATLRPRFSFQATSDPLAHTCPVGSVMIALCLSMTACHSPTSYLLSTRIPL